MFRACIQKTPLTSDAANDFFQNITGSSYGGDVSFLATLRALLTDRMKEGDEISVRFSVSTYSKQTLTGASDESVVSAICRSFIAEERINTICVHSFSSDHESNLYNMEIIERAFENKYPGYHCLGKVSEFYKKSFAVLCYINPDMRDVVLFVDNLDLRRLHYLQVSILAFLPWYFNPGQGISDLEMKLIYSLRETTPDKYMDCLNQIASKYDFRSAQIKKLLTGFELRFEKEECDRERQRSLDCVSEINSLNERIGELIAHKRNLDISILGLMKKIEDGGDDSEIMDYFLCNHKLTLESVDGTSMSFAVKDYITYFDSEMAERTIDNQNSYVYEGGGHSRTGKDDMKMLLKEIFVSDAPRIRIKTCASYSFNINGSVHPNGDHNFGFEFSDCMPNPHIDRYSCMGNYTRTINNLLTDRNYIGAIEQCVASCKSLNWGDSAVMSVFMDTMWGHGGYNNRCLELQNGSVVKPADAIKWLKEQNCEKTEETEVSKDE